MNVVNNLNNFTIDGIDFSGIGKNMLKCTNQLNYKTSPGRQHDGSMWNINDYDSFVLPQVEIGFNLIPIDLFWKLRKILLAKRVFNVTYYDVDFNDWVTHEMYAHPDELKAFLNRGEEIIGVQGFKITLVATLNEDTIYNAIFKYSDDKKTILSAPWGRSIKIPTLPSGYSYWAEENDTNKTIKLYKNDRLNIFKNNIVYTPN